MKKRTQPETKVYHAHIRWLLVFLDFLILLFATSLILVFYGNYGHNSFDHYAYLIQTIAFLVICFSVRFIFKVYHQIWRYGGIQSYIRLLLADTLAFAIYYCVDGLLPVSKVSLPRAISIYSINLLGSLTMRMVYRYAYKYCESKVFWKQLLYIFGDKSVKKKCLSTSSAKINIAIVGAGRVGTGLAEELAGNEKASFNPKCFIDTDIEKIGREIHGLPVLAEGDLTELADFEVQEIVFALPQLEPDKKIVLYEKYKAAGYKIKVYDYPVLQSAGKKVLREFDIEELLFRKPIEIQNEKTRAFYQGKVILVTGGGGSIGSEICRQIAKMNPKQIVVLDVYENGAYDLQQELKIIYGNSLDVRIEIVSVCNEKGLNRVFDKYKPQIVIMAAAHKHVPLMENNGIEAVENNVFGTLNTVKLSIQHEVERVIMVSTDKAVNPTNIMGATKRMCEMVVQAYSASGCKTTFSATRFGNVLGSAGSVIPLFKKQIASGGPVTITDKKIIRYFMTIPEASQLVLESGAMAQNGELFVLDMGKPVKIYDLAENLIRLSGLEPGIDIEIIETGLRLGEKLYEELLVKSENLSKTENKLIFIEKDAPLSMALIEEKLELLHNAVNSGSEETLKETMTTVVPTYHRTDKGEKVNA